MYHWTEYANQCASYPEYPYYDHFYSVGNGPFVVAFGAWLASHDNGRHLAEEEVLALTDFSSEKGPNNCILSVIGSVAELSGRDEKELYEDFLKELSTHFGFDAIEGQNSLKFSHNGSEESEYPLYSHCEDEKSLARRVAKNFEALAASNAGTENGRTFFGRVENGLLDLYLKPRGNEFVGKWDSNRQGKEVVRLISAPPQAVHEIRNVYHCRVQEEGYLSPRKTSENAEAPHVERSADELRKTSEYIAAFNALKRDRYGTVLGNSPEERRALIDHTAYFKAAERESAPSSENVNLRGYRHAKAVVDIDVMGKSSELLVDRSKFAGKQNPGEDPEKVHWDSVKCRLRALTADLNTMADGVYFVKDAVPLGKYMKDGDTRGFVVKKRGGMATVYYNTAGAEKKKSLNKFVSDNPLNIDKDKEFTLSVYGRR